MSAKVFYPAAPHLTSPDGRIAVWYLEPLTMIYEITSEHYSKADALFIAGSATRKLRALRQGSQPGCMVNLLQRVRSYDKEARTLLIPWTRQNRAEGLVDRAWVVLGDHAPALLRMGVNAIVMAMSLPGVVGSPPRVVFGEDGLARVREAFPFDPHSGVAAAQP